MCKYLASRWSHRIEQWLDALSAPATFRNADVPQPSRGRSSLVLLLAALAIIYSAEAVARAFLPLLLRDHPLLLISLDSHTHDLLLAGLKLPAFEFICVGVTWRFATHFTYYLLGRWYGNSALLWLAGRWSRAASLTGKIQAIFSRVSDVAVFLFSDNVVCVLAGSVGMSPIRFIVLHLSGTVLHILALFFVAHLAIHPLTRIVAFIDSDAAILTVLFMIVTIVSIAVSATVHRSRIRDFTAMMRRPADRPLMSLSEDRPEDGGQ